MIVTVTLNPCIDKTIEMNGFALGETNKAASVREDIGGKGINVSVAVKQLGFESSCIGFERAGGRLSISQMLKDKGITNLMTPTPGNMRCNLKLFDNQTHEMTEILESGEAVEQEDIVRFFSDLKSIKTADALVCSGSAAPGVKAECYYDIISYAKNELGCLTVLDARGEYMKKGILANPDYIKPNIAELEELCGKKLNTHDEMIIEAKKLIENGIGKVCLSLGKDGALLICNEGVWFAPPVSIKVRGVQGAGDSMVAAICIAEKLNKTPPEILRYAVAAAAASLEREGTLMCTAESFEKMLTLVKTVQIL